MRRWRSRNLEKSREMRRQWYNANREKAKNNLLKYRQANRFVIAASKYLGGITDDVRSFAALASAGCCYCGSSDKLQVDHKVPKSRGGKNERANLQWLCRKCNHAKFDMAEEEFFSHVECLYHRRFGMGL
jgi:5-methylcytosine-specific restriction endonuclease McrA